MVILYFIFLDIRVTPTPTPDFYVNMCKKRDSLYLVFNNISPLGHRMIFSSLSEDEGFTWGSRVLIGEANRYAYYPDIDYGRNDSFFIVAKDTTHTGFFYYVMFSNAFQGTVYLDDYTWYRNILYPQIAVDENTHNKFIIGELNGKIRVIFEQGNTLSFSDLEGISCHNPVVVKGNDYVYAAYRVGRSKITLAKSTFSASSWSYADLNGEDISYFDIYYHNGKVGIVYKNGDELLYSVYQDGGFSTSITVIEDEDATSPQIAFSDENIFISFIKDKNVYLLTSRDGENFQGPFLVSDTSTVVDSVYSTDMVSFGETAFVCWLDERNDSTDIYGEVVDIEGIIQKDKSVSEEITTKFIEMASLDRNFYEDCENIITIDGRKINLISRPGIYYIFKKNRIERLIVWR